VALSVLALGVLGKLLGALLLSDPAVVDAEVLTTFEYSEDIMLPLDGASMVYVAGALIAVGALLLALGTRRRNK